MNEFVYYEIQAIYARQFDVIPIGMGIVQAIQKNISCVCI